MNKLLSLTLVVGMFSSGASCSSSPHIHFETHQNDNGESAKFLSKVWDSVCEGSRQVSQAVEHGCEAAVDTWKDRPDQLKGTGFFKDWKENVKK